MSELDNEIILLKEWMEDCEKRCKCHSLSQTYYSILNLCLSIPAIGLSTVAGSGNIGVGSSTSGTCNNSKSWLSILFGTLGLVSASLFTIHRSMAFPELQKAHGFYSCEFEKLALEIKMQLVLDKKTEYHTYKNIAEFMKECKKNMDILIDRAPIIPDNIVKKVAAQKDKDKALVTVQLG